jgi:AraC-like DNA-binding protein
VVEAASLRELRLHQRPFRTQAAETWPALYGILQTAEPATVVVVDPFADDETAPARELFTLLDDFPSVAVVCVFEVTPARVGDIRQMLLAGVSGFVDLRVDTAAGIAVRHIREAAGRPFKRRVEAVTPQHLSADARHIIRAACDAALTGGGVDDVAAMFGVSARTLSTWCQKFGPESTRSLLLWMRLLLASLLMEDQCRTIDGAARAAGYASDRSLRRAFEQTLDAAPSSVRKGGALPQVSVAFAAWLREVCVAGGS